ncbi:FAD-dependent thymidylate synthase [Candidatus Woesearchaeota archaeon]|nr:FAD-dependent thymidylate synthase [Candidatus Woesearchaeota archaeon]
MEVKLAGFNVDKDGLRKIELALRKDKLSKEEKAAIRKSLRELGPETIAASYARISRDPRKIPELREDARRDVKASRQTNQAVIFSMGHKSIAEHAFFNFDIMGLSRTAVEALEEKRLQAYTEKSQRYITMEGDFVIPREIKGTGLEKRFIWVVDRQNGFYKRNIGTITDWHHKQDYEELFKSLKQDIKIEHSADKVMELLKKQKGTREGLGKEDARYSLGLSTQAQIGYSASARNIETLITKLRSADNEEERELGEKIFKVVDGLAPSVIKYTKPVDYFSKTRAELAKHVGELIKKYKFNPDDEFNRAKLFTGMKRDDSIPAGLIFSSSNLPFSYCLGIAKRMSDEEKINLLNQADKYQEVHDPKLREYELGDRVAEMGMSSSAFAQMKRHRMNTLIPQSYNPGLGFTLPPSVEAVGLQQELTDVVNDSVSLYYAMLGAGLHESVADYALTNANSRRVLFDANNRQVYAFCAERENLPAQWDIRRTANEYAEAMQKESPVTLRSLCGKDKFNDVKKTQTIKPIVTDDDKTPF